MNISKCSKGVATGTMPQKWIDGERPDQAPGRSALLTCSRPNLTLQTFFRKTLQSTHSFEYLEILSDHLQRSWWPVHSLKRYNCLWASSWLAASRPTCSLFRYRAMGKKPNDEQLSISLADIKHDTSGLWFDDGDIVVVGSTEKIGFKVRYSRSRSLRDQCHLVRTWVWPQVHRRVLSHDSTVFADLIFRASSKTPASAGAPILSMAVPTSVLSVILSALYNGKKYVCHLGCMRSICLLSISCRKVLLGRLCAHFLRTYHSTHREFQPQARPLIQGSRPPPQAMLS